MDKEQLAILRLQEASRMSLQVYKQPLVVTTSGGKDSSVCVALAERAGIPFEVQHNLTTADAPETVYFVRAEFKRLEEAGIKCTVNYPVYKRQRTSMWQLIPQKLIPPTRFRRYCCSVLKERGGAGRFITTGVRWEESASRKNNRGIYEAGREIILNNDNDDRRRLFESCRLKATRVCNPIIDWTDADVWEYITSERLSLDPLYQCGFSRVGCIGCPMAGTKSRQKEFARYPKFQQAARLVRNWIRCVQRRRKKLGLPPLKYIAVTERGKRSGRYHHHVTLSGGIDRDELEKLWHHGYANSRRLQFNEEGLTGLAYYITKSPVGKKAWTASKNLVDPEPRTRDERISGRKARELAENIKDNTRFEKLYPGYLCAKAEAFHNEVNGGLDAFFLSLIGTKKPPFRFVCEL